MPLLEAWAPQPHALAAIWRIEEPEDFFIAQTGIRPDIKNEKRRMERLAGRFLLRHLKDDFPLHQIFADAHDKPRIPDDQYFFSISHSYPYIAAMVSSEQECGIDIQTWHPRIEVLQHKFLSREEQLFFRNDAQLLALAWCAKEAAYKWLGRRGIDFIEQLPVTAVTEVGSISRITILAGSPPNTRQVAIQGFCTQDFALAHTTDYFQ